MIEFLSPVFNTTSAVAWAVVPFLFVLTVVVFVHEMGHFLVGRWCGIGVLAFSVGFGPELVGFTDRRGTRWKLCAIPLGGYVKFVGDMGAASLPDAARLDGLNEQQRSVAFHTQPVWKRALTVFAGPAFNFLLTIAVFTVMFSLYGRFVSDPVVTAVIENSPAAEAGILPGDRFVSVDGRSVKTFADVARYVSGRADDAIVFVMSRDGHEVTRTITPRITDQEDPLGNRIKVATIGVRQDAAGQSRLISYTPVEALGQATLETGRIIAATGQFLNRFVAGRENRCQLGGPVKIADIAGKAARMGFEWLVQITAFLSVSIGILNLLPLPPLDGGHLVFYAVEAVQGRPLSQRVTESIFRAGFILLLAFMGFVFWNDLFPC